MEDEIITSNKAKKEIIVPKIMEIIENEGYYPASVWRNESGFFGEYIWAHGSNHEYFLNPPKGFWEKLFWSRKDHLFVDPPKKFESDHIRKYRLLREIGVIDKNILTVERDEYAFDSSKHIGGTIGIFEPNYSEKTILTKVYGQDNFLKMKGLGEEISKRTNLKLSMVLDSHNALPARVFYIHGGGWGT